jgi:Protein of unknown function (DUF3617)
MRIFALAVTLLVTAGGAVAATSNIPRRKSGLWEITVSSDGAKGGQTMQQCIDEKSDDLIKNNMAGTEKQSCSKNEFRREGAKLITESVCKMSGSTATTTGVFTGQFDSSYRADIKSTYEPPLQGMKQSATTMEAKWLGSCKPGQKPGDISMPGMPDININDMMKNLPKRP